MAPRFELRCRGCGWTTTPEEATARRFNEGCCSQCGIGFQVRVVPEEPKDAGTLVEWIRDRIRGIAIAGLRDRHGMVHSFHEELSRRLEDCRPVCRCGKPMTHVGGRHWDCECGWNVHEPPKIAVSPITLFVGGVDVASGKTWSAMKCPDRACPEWMTRTSPGNWKCRCGATVTDT